MRHYETVFIADPDIPPDVQQTLFEKARTLISGNAGELVNFDEWGNKRLAYEIRKKQRGHYVRLDYCGTGSTVSSLENAFRIDERVLKFMTVMLDKEADLEQLKAAVEAARLPEKTAAEDAGKPAEPETAAAEDAAKPAEPETAGAVDDAGQDDPAGAADDAGQEDPAGAETSDEDNA